MNKNKGIILSILLVIIVIGGIVIYKNKSSEKKYKDSIESGMYFMSEMNYDEAILAFQEAIDIKPSEAVARIYLAKNYMHNMEFDRAVEVLRETQDTNLKDEDLLKEMIEILNWIDTDISYEFLENYIDAVEEEAISKEVKAMYDEAFEIPTYALVDNATGTYDGSVTVKLNDSLIKVGHAYYYTTDGSRPTKNSTKYRGEIEILEDTTLNIIGYSKNEQPSSLITMNYTIGNKKSSSDKDYGHGIDEMIDDDDYPTKNFNQEIALEYLINKAGINATKTYNKMGEAQYTYKVNDSYGGYTNYNFATIGDMEVIGGKNAFRAYITEMSNGSNNYYDVGSYIIFEDGTIEEDM